MKVLVVDDDVSMAQLLAAIFEDRGHRVIAAETGATARWVLQHCQPDLILMDLMLPDCDGLTLIALFKGLSCAPVIVLSARESSVDRALCKQLGAADYILKPFDLDDLEARVDAVMEIRA